MGKRNKAARHAGSPNRAVRPLGDGIRRLQLGNCRGLAAVLLKNRVPHGSTKRDRKRRDQAADVPGSGFPWCGLRGECSCCDFYNAGEEVAEWAWWELRPEKF